MSIFDICRKLQLDSDEKRNWFYRKDVYCYAKFGEQFEIAGWFVIHLAKFYPERFIEQGITLKDLPIWVKESILYWYKQSEKTIQITQ